jgi:pectinesterase
VYLRDQLPAEIAPEGWNNWGKASNEQTAWFGEYEDRGPGARPADRVAWAHTLTAAEAKQFEPRRFLAGKDGWDPVKAAGGLP